MKRRSLLIGLALALALPVSTGLATDPATTEAPAADPAAEEAALKAEWQGRYRTLIRELEATSAQLEADRRNWSKARQRGRLKGGSREDLQMRITENEAKLAELEQAAKAFPEEARRNGIPPGWLREAAASPAP